MKKYVTIRVAIALLLLISVSVVSVYALTFSGTVSDGEQKTALSLNEYDLQIDNTSIKNETFEQMILSANAILSKYDAITLDSNKYLEVFINHNQEPLSNIVNIEGDTISVDTRKLDVSVTQSDGNSTFTYTMNSEEKVRYLIVLSFITTKYNNCIVELGFEADPALNHIPVPTLFICPDYAKAGYDSAQAYYTAFTSGECELEYDSYYLSLHSAHICTTSDLFTNYFEELDSTIAA